MANPSPDNVAELLRIGGQMANVMFNLAQWPGDALTGAHVAALDSLRKQWDAAVRVTPPSPSTAPEVDERAAFEAWLAAPKDEEWSTFNIWRAGRRSALASRPAEVDDEGLPPLPPGAYAWEYSGGIVYDEDEFRQGQRDAVAADRARRAAVGGGQ